MLENWISRFRTMVIQQCIAARKRARVRRDHSNCSKLVALGLKCLRGSQWRAVITDKDGGFALVNDDDIYDIKESIFKKAYYKEVSPWEYDVQSIVKWHSSMCDAIAVFEKRVPTGRSADEINENAESLGKSEASDQLQIS